MVNNKSRGFRALLALCIAALCASCRLDSESLSPMDQGASGTGAVGIAASGAMAATGGTAAIGGMVATGGVSASDASDPDSTKPDAMVVSEGVRCRAEAAAPQITDYSKQGPFPVGILELTLTDASRPIEATAEHAAVPERVLQTRIYYPASSVSILGEAPLLASDGKPFPMLMYSHGYSSNWDESKPPGNHAASHGYIVVSPIFPLTSLGANDGAPDTKDIPNQPGDISFLIDTMLAFSNDSSHQLAGAVDAERIGALGVSAGGLTTLLVSLHEKYHDPRIKVAAPVAPFAAFFEAPFYSATRTIPLLIEHGDMDAFLPYEINGRRAFEYAKPNAFLLTVARGSHAAFALPIDGALQGLLSGLIVPPEWSQDNADAMGCAAVGDTLREDPLAVLDTLEGPYVNHDIQIEGDDLVCVGDELTMPALGVEEQRAIFAQSIVSFFDAHFGETEARRNDGCRYLLHELPKNPDVIVE